MLKHLLLTLSLLFMLISCGPRQVEVSYSISSTAPDVFLCQDQTYTLEEVVAHLDQERAGRYASVYIDVEYENGFSTTKDIDKIIDAFQRRGIIELEIS